MTTPQRTITIAITEAGRQRFIDGGLLEPSEPLYQMRHVVSP